jgi:hypothetical protein
MYEDIKSVVSQTSGYEGGLTVNEGRPAEKAIYHFAYIEPNVARLTGLRSFPLSSSSQLHQDKTVVVVMSSARSQGLSRSRDVIVGELVYYPSETDVISGSLQRIILRALTEVRIDGLLMIRLPGPVAIAALVIDRQSLYSFARRALVTTK